MCQRRALMSRDHRRPKQQRECHTCRPHSPSRMNQPGRYRQTRAAHSAPTMPGQSGLGVTPRARQQESRAGREQRGDRVGREQTSLQPRVLVRRTSPTPQLHQQRRHDKSDGQMQKNQMQVAEAFGDHTVHFSNPTGFPFFRKA